MQLTRPYMENTGDTFPSIPDLQTAPLNLPEQVDGAPQDRFSRHLPRVPDGVRPRTHHQRWRSWSFLVVNIPPKL
jgi:hypothetical protein